MEVEEPNAHRLGNGLEAQQVFYNQIREDWSVKGASKVMEAELDGSLILEYTWEF